MNKKRMEKKGGEYLLYIYLKTTQGKKMLPEINNIYTFVPVLNYQRKKMKRAKKHNF